jgi:hypothetical protein
MKLLKNIQNINFDKTRHSYFLDDKQFFSTSKIIACLKDLSKIPTHVLEKARDRGTDIHEITELIDLGKRPKDIFPEYKPYIKAFDEFNEEEGYKLFALPEFMVISNKGEYSCTIDRIYTKNKKIYIADIKSTAKFSWVFGMQLAAYVNAFEEIYKLKVAGRLVIKLNKYGGYELKPEAELIPQAEAMQLFYECQNIYIKKIQFTKLYDPEFYQKNYL